MPKPDADVPDPKRLVLRATFDEDAERYHRARPSYPSNLIDHIVSSVSSGRPDPADGTRVLEIGCGTGQATRLLAPRVGSVLAVDLGVALAEVARRELAMFDNVNVVVGDAEKLDPAAGPFDAIVAFTMFHWLDAATRSARLRELLTPDGSLVVVSTHHVEGGTSPFFAEVQECYESWDPSTVKGQRLPEPEHIIEDTSEFERSGFSSVSVKRFDQIVSTTTAEYLDVLQTYSGHIDLPSEQRVGLLGCIGNLIDGSYGGRVEKAYHYLVTIARR